MITYTEILEYCLKKKAAFEDYPFGPYPICVKVGSKELGGKIFMQIFANADDYRVTVKCDPELAKIFRYEYAGAVIAGYHCPPVMQAYFNTIYIEKIEEFGAAVLWEMIDHSYEQAVKSMTKKARAAFDL